MTGFRKTGRVTFYGGEHFMTIRPACVYVVMVNTMFSFAGCSLWGPESRGAAQFDSSTLEGQSKSLAGVYRDIGTDGSIQPHPRSAGTGGGRIDDPIILGGPAYMPNIQTGTMELKGSKGPTTPTVRMGEKTFPSGSDKTGSPGGVGKP